MDLWESYLFSFIVAIKSKIHLWKIVCEVVYQKHVTKSFKAEKGNFDYFGKKTSVLNKPWSA